MDIKYSRRKFIHSTSAGLAGVLILPSLGACTSKQTKGLGVKTITMGAIGLGRRGMTVA